MIKTLSPKALRWEFTDFKLVEEAFKHPKTPKKGPLGFIAQARALSALELGLGIRQRGYNIFVVGAQGTGRTSTVNKILTARALKEESANDIVLLYNFENRDRPLAIELPSSMGPKVKKAYDSLLDRLLSGLEKAFDSQAYLNKQKDIQDNQRVQSDNALADIETEANTQGFVLQRGAGALTITPSNKKGEAISEEEFETLAETKKQQLESKAERLELHLEDTLRKLRSIERHCEEESEKIERETATRVLKPLFDTAKTAWKSHKSIVSHLEAMQEDVILRVHTLVIEDKISHLEGGDSPTQHNVKRRALDEDDEGDGEEPTLLRYRVNVLVTHAKNGGAPVVHETHPTSSNLIGRIEQRIRGGETITDFTRIRAGALYYANGGYLVIEAQEILRDASAWEGLKRSLKNRMIELDDPGEPGRMVSIASLRPETVPLDLKVILIGTPEVFYALTKNDPDFPKLFKVKADFDIEMTRTKEHIVNYLRFLAGVAHEEKLRRLSPLGVAKVIEYAVRLASNQKKLTSRLGDMADLVREADFWASKDKSNKIDVAHITKALEKKAEREGFLENQMVEDILEHRITIETDGEVVGQCNALTVIEVGSYEFGLPMRITAKVGAGKGEIIDIERETQMGGPIHTKGTLIIRGLLLDRFGKEVPLALTATICLEQTYSDIDGDSASLAEASALFSALSEVPIQQHFAVTGSIDQRGIVQAVGGVNEKIEGFYNICKQRKSKETHGVIIPASNAQDVMLKDEVIEAVKDGRFIIYTAETLEDALELLTGTPWKGKGPNLKDKALNNLRKFQKLINPESFRRTPYSMEEERKSETLLAPASLEAKSR